MAIGHLDDNGSWVIGSDQPDEAIVRSALDAQDPVAAFQPLFEAGLDPNYHFGYHGSLLFRAIAEDKPALVTFLLQQGALVTVGGPMISPLAACCWLDVTNGEFMATSLLAAGADPIEQEALFAAAREFRPEIAKVILDRLGEKQGEALNTTADELKAKQVDIDFGLGTPLHEIVANAVDDDGEEARDETLEAAKTLVRLFVERGADVQKKDAKGRTASELANVIGAEEVGKLLNELTK